MKKILLLTVVAISMFSFTAFAEEVYDVDGAAIECNSDLTKVVETDETSKESTAGSTRD